MLEKTLSEIKEDGTKKYKGGVARVSRVSLDNLMNDGPLEGKIGYKRDDPIILERPFHGDVLLGEEFRLTKDKHGRARLYGVLSMAIIEHIPQQV